MIHDSQLYPQMVLVVFRILNTCVPVFFLYCVCGLVSLISWLFLWFLVCGLVHVLYLSLVPLVIVMSSESILVCPQECSNSHIWILCDDHKMWGFSCMNWVILVPWMFGSWRVNSLDILEGICMFWGFHSVVDWRFRWSGTWCQMDWEFFTCMLEVLVCSLFRVEEDVTWRNCCIM